MILTTSDAVFERRISSYCGIVSGEGRPDETDEKALKFLYSIAEIASNTSAAGFRLHTGRDPVVCEYVDSAGGTFGTPGQITQFVMKKVERMVLARAHTITHETVEGDVEFCINGERVPMATQWDICGSESVLSFRFSDETSRPGGNLPPTLTSECSRVAMMTVEDEAAVVGADAVVGIRVTVDPETGVVSAFGTAVKLESAA